MSREHGEVRLRRAPLSGRWEAVRIADDGRTITDKWPIHADDAAHLDEMSASTEDRADNEGTR